jgi:hypothetical protein
VQAPLKSSEQSRGRGGSRSEPKLSLSRETTCLRTRGDTGYTFGAIAMLVRLPSDGPQVYRSARKKRASRRQPLPPPGQWISVLVLPSLELTKPKKPDANGASMPRLLR